MFSGCAQQSRAVAERKTRLARAHRLSVSRPARLLGLSWGSGSYPRRPASVAALAFMRRLDAWHLEYPFAGSRMLRGLLRQEGHEVGRLHVATLMKRMGSAALYQRPTTSPPTPGHQIYPYLLRQLAVTRPNHVWAMASTDGPMARGFVYLVAVLAWFSRKGLAWCLSLTLEMGPCVEAFHDALAGHGPSEIMNTDQGRQFTAVAFLTALQDAQIAISMDGTGAWRDNVMGERLWRTIKYEEVYLRASRSVSEARSGLGRYLAFYNRSRPHSALGGQHPTKSISTSRRPSRRRHHQSGEPLIDSPQPVQNNRATSVSI